MKGELSGGLSGGLRVHQWRVYTAAGSLMGFAAERTFHTLLLCYSKPYMFVHSCWFPVGPAAVREPFADADYPWVPALHWERWCPAFLLLLWLHLPLLFPDPHRTQGNDYLFNVKSKWSVWDDKCACATPQMVALLRLINKYSSSGSQMEICSGFTTHSLSCFLQSFHAVCMGAFENDTEC